MINDNSTVFSGDKLQNQFTAYIERALINNRISYYRKYNNKIIYDDRIRERSCGDLSGKPLEVTNREEYWNYNTTIKYGTSENIKLFFDRVYNFLDELKTKDYERVLIVAHSGVSKAFNGYFEGIKDGKFLNRGLKNCEIKEYEL